MDAEELGGTMLRQLTGLFDEKDLKGKRTPQGRPVHIRHLTSVV